jgi:hypothetical protein
MASKTIHLVWNPDMSECWGTDSAGDAHYVATGDMSRCFTGTPSTGDNFREAYAEEADDGILPMTVIEVPDDAQLANKEDTKVSDQPVEGYLDHRGDTDYWGEIDNSWKTPVADSDIDTSDIPEQGEDFFKRAVLTKHRLPRTSGDPEI